MPKPDQGKGKKKQPIKRKSSRDLWLVVGLAVVVVGAIVFALQFGGKGEPNAAISTADVKTDTQLQAKMNVIGKANAKVQIVEYGDYL